LCEERRRALEAVAEEVLSCKRCPLHATRTRAVPGEGDPCARVMFVGEAPGYNEDLQGRPFVGAAGNLLNEMLKLAGLNREEVFITNVVKCRPPNNRDPAEEEVEACKPYLLRQLKVIQPEIVVCLGRHSARVLFELAGLRFESIMRARGEPRRLTVSGLEILCLPTLHPAAALYNPRLRNLLEADFRALSRLTSTRREGLERWF
jgi:uracil-DNA glycosylase family 4